MMTGHALSRLAERMPLEDAQSIIATLETYAAQCDPFESVAVRVRTLASFVGHAWSDDSNGDTIVAVIRARSIFTVMYRRRSQPFTRVALNVERTVIL